MKLYEYQAKRIFSENGIKVPRGIVASSSFEVYETVKEFGAPVVIKAQVLVGGRGLSGGISFVEDPYEARRVADELIGGSLKNEDVHAVLIEEKVQIMKEFYIGSLIDYESESIVIMASSKGGVDIESLALGSPGEIVKEKIDPVLGLTDYTARRIAKAIGCLLYTSPSPRD